MTDVETPPLGGSKRHVAARPEAVLCVSLKAQSVENLGFFPDRRGEDVKLCRCLVKGNQSADVYMITWYVCARDNMCTYMYNNQYIYI